MKKAQTHLFTLALITVLTATSFAIAAPQAASTDGAQRDLIETLDRLKRAGLLSQREINQQFTLSEIRISETASVLTARELTANGVDVHLPPTNLETETPSTGTPLDDLKDLTLEKLGDVSTWITIGSKIWKLVVDNAPVANVQTQTVSVMPQGLEWNDMAGWQGPYAKSYTISATNAYGVTVISHTYTVAFTYGGNVQGKGQFLANATIIPSNVDVAWGFKLSSDVEVGKPVNTGSYAQPTPGLDLTVKWKMNSILKHIEGRDQFFVRGDGTHTHTTL